MSAQPLLTFGKQEAPEKLQEHEVGLTLSPVYSVLQESERGDRLSARASHLVFLEELGDMP